MATTDENSNAALQGIARHINCLTEDNRNTRKKALEGIRKDTLNRKPSLEAAETQTLFSEFIKPVLKCFSDPVEKCREMSIQLITDFLRILPDPCENLPYVVPVISIRLGQQEIVEPSEELRLLLVELLIQILEFSGKKIAAYLDDYIRILCRTIIDPFPEVKKESCKCASKLAKSIPEYFHMQAASLIKPLLMTIAHQHSRVRLIVVETIGDVIQYGTGKEVDSVVSHLAQRLFDQTPSVRKAVVKVVGNWLLDLPDRYSFHHKFIPLLLTGVTDDQPEICEIADALWNDVGLKYEKENEEELKDQIDFEKEAPSHYPKGVERPNLGCRTLMMRNFSKMCPALMRDVCDWVVATRIKSAALLYPLLLNCEGYVTQHMEMLLNGLYKAAMDDEPKVITDLKRAAELIGYFVKPEIWCKMIIKTICTTQSYSSVMVLACVMRGSERALLKPYLEDLCNVINLPEVCQTVQVPLHNELLACVDAIVTVLGEEVSIVSQPLFDLLITVLALRQNQETADKVYSLLDRLYQSQALESRLELFSRHTKTLIDSFKETFGMWSIHSTERLIFDTLLLEAGPVIGDLLEDVIPVLISNLNPEKDAEMRLKFFSLLSKLMMNATGTLDSRHRFGDFAVLVVKDIIIPNCVWKAGRTAGAIRTTAVSCMWALLQSGVLTKEKLMPEVESLLTQLISIMDDNNTSTRLISCRVMTRVFDLMGSSLDQDRLHNMYPDLLKRLDDSSDEVRVTVATTFLAYLDCFQDNYDPGLYKAHVEAIYRGLLVHLDDQEQNIQEAILGVLKKAASLTPGILITEVETAKHKHRSTKYCDQILQYTKGLLEK